MSKQKLNTTRNKTICLFEKVMVLRLTGTSPKEIQEVAYSIHALPHPHLIGGRENRKVSMTCESTQPSKIFNGRV